MMIRTCKKVSNFKRDEAITKKDVLLQELSDMRRMPL